MESLPPRLCRTLIGVLGLVGAFGLGLVVGESRGIGPSPDLPALAPAREPSTGLAGPELPAAPPAVATAAALERAVSARVEGAGVPGLGGLLRTAQGADASPRTPTSSQVTSIVSLLLEMQRTDEAYELMLEVPADSTEVYAELGAALAAAGRSAEAIYLFSEALRRGHWDDDMLGDFVAVDPGACLAAIERESVTWSLNGYLDEDELDAYRARALHGLGRTAEAIALLPGPERLLVEGRGCVPKHIEGETWEWRAWMTAEPERVEGLLLEVAHRPLAPSGRALGLLAELYAMHGRREELERELARWEREYGGLAREYTQIVVDLAPLRGWDTVRGILERRPWDSAAALGLGEHLAQAGRVHEAAEVWGEFMQAAWEKAPDSEELAETVARAPRYLMPRLELLVTRALAKEADDHDRADELGSLGDAFWDLGRRSRAVELWERAQAIDPSQCWSWSLKQAELGVDPR